MITWRQNLNLQPPNINDRQTGTNSNRVALLQKIIGLSAKKNYELVFLL